MKIKLFQTGNEKSISEYPLGLGYLKSNCSETDISIVASATELNNCDLIGISTSAWGIKEAIDILERAKAPVIIGGQGCLWKELKNYHFKHIIIGDGETSLKQIIRGYADRILFNPIKNIDNLKFPDRGKCEKIIPIITSRGCPFSCNFCSSKEFWGNVRYHSAQYFIDEVLDILQKYPQAKELYILDDLFIGNKKRFQEIYEEWMSLGLDTKLQLKSFVRSNLITLEIAQQMKNMGFKKIRFGAESGSNRMLALLNKQATVENHQNAINIARQVKLPISASFMYGLPEETPEDLQMTKDFINKNKLQVEGWYKFQPFPGTKFYNNESPLNINMKVR